jgi:(5-formylfuran-3-yl)methyl phosphate synthase
MTKLLVSVRDVAEARLALAAGVDLIDVKEPRAGSLGAAAADVMAEIAEVVRAKRPLSVALGDLDQFEASPLALPAGIGFAKLGLARCAGRCDWPARWQAVLATLPAETAAVAVVYADQANARSPAARPVLTQARRLGCRAILVDTFDKQTGGLLDHWSIEQVEWLIATARAEGLLVVLAGRLSVAMIERLLPLEADYVAVRSAACDAGRDGSISADRLAELVALVGTSQG